MNHRHLGQSGLVVTEILYGNWIMHASQFVEWVRRGAGTSLD
jgi:hypothetical protein